MQPSELSKAIHEDGPLASKRRLLVGLSMLLIAICFTGAKISEANTLFFKITFANMDGILNLLLVSIGFSLFRYYSYTSIYQEAITKEWTGKLLKHSFFYSACEHSDLEGGYMVDIAPAYTGYNDNNFRHDDDSSLSESFNANCFFNAQIKYDLFNQNGHVQNERVHLFSLKQPRQSIRALLLVLRCWWDAQVRYRESLDIYAPYLIAFTAIGLTIYPILVDTISMLMS
tara:strand:- start:31844 stop:32530 length:687 start_codon:yes stop_codon:yes gene_type:complete